MKREMNKLLLENEINLIDALIGSFERRFGSMTPQEIVAVLKDFKEEHIRKVNA